MKFLSATMLSLIVTGTQALAAPGGANVQSMGLLGTFFIAFAVLVVLFQVLPGATLFLGILKGIFSSGIKKPGADAVEHGKTNH